MVASGSTLTAPPPRSDRLGRGLRSDSRSTLMTPPATEPTLRFPPLANTRGVLVTGSHRSGTTWVGKMLATAPNVAYIHEPFKPGWSLPYTFTRADLYFQHVAGHNAARWEPDVLRTLRFNYSWAHTYREAPGLRQAFKATSKWARWNSRRYRGHRPLLKDPIALFATPWLADRFGMDAVVMIRHPAAFCSSIKLKRWTFDFKQWVCQTELMDTLLVPFRDEIAAKAEKNDDLIDQAILQWRVFHHVIDVYRKARPDFLYVRHEDLSLDPVGGFRKMFEHCKLEWTPASEKTIRESSDEGNLKDANAAGKSTHFVQLDAKANVKNWQKRLSADEVRRIRAGTEDVSPLFYTDADWA
jgi:hypothetical protein